MMPAKLRSIEAKALVPARDFELSKRFYQVRYINERWISVGHGSGFVNLALEWQRERGLRLVFKDSHFISNPG